MANDEFVRVPREPTAEMLELFARQFCIVQGIDPDKQINADWPAWYPMCQGLDECYKAMLAAAPLESAQTASCEYCDGTGDIHRLDGEWLGRCPQCGAGKEG